MGYGNSGAEEPLMKTVGEDVGQRDWDGFVGGKGAEAGVDDERDGGDENESGEDVFVEAEEQRDRGGFFREREGEQRDGKARDVGDEDKRREQEWREGGGDGGE